MPAGGLRGVPALPAGAGAGADRLLHSPRRASFWGGGEEPGQLVEARAALAGFVGARTDDLVFVPNPTSGLNAVIRSLSLGPEDEVLTTAHEYGAIVRTWEFMGANLVVCEPDELAERIGPRTRVVFLSHITSPTALLLPVGTICVAAREAGVLSVVDGAHAPGHVAVDLESLGADIYARRLRSRLVVTMNPWSCASRAGHTSTPNGDSRGSANEREGRCRSIYRSSATRRRLGPG